MRFEFFKRRGMAVAAATVTAMTVGGIAWASIPDATSGRLYACYDAAGNVKLYDPDSNNRQGCPAGQTLTYWNQAGLQGPTGRTGAKGDKGDKGDTGATGPQGPAGRNDIHWAMSSGQQSGQKPTATSDAGTVVYTYGHYRYFWFPGLDIDKCAISASATDNNLGKILGSYQRYYGYVLTATLRLESNGTTTPVEARTEIQLACGAV